MDNFTDLPLLVGENGAEIIIVHTNDVNKKVSFGSVVIAPCKYCLSNNAISNSNCVSCGAPLGQVNNDK